jgi:hypothetical protein
VAGTRYVFSPDKPPFHPPDAFDARKSAHSKPFASSSVPPAESRLHLAQAGDVTGKINGKWQEIRYGAGASQDTDACSTGCSDASNSEGLGDNKSPWTVMSSTSCVLLEVMEGYHGGEAVFEVFNNEEESLGKTSDIPIEKGSYSCYADPFGCYKDPNVGKGKFMLKKNVAYSLNIVAVRSDTPNINKVDGGWFRLKSTPCVPCAVAKEACSSTVPCCEGLGLVCGPIDGICKPDGTCAVAKEACSSTVPCCKGLVCGPIDGICKPVCAVVKEKCSKATPCCTGLVCHLNKVTGKRKCRTDPTPNQLCANVKEQCGNGIPCCKGLECRADKNTGKLKCRITNLGGGSTQALNMCAAAKEKCGKAKMCCVGLVCRTNKANGMHTCRMKKNGGLGGTTLGG